MIVITLESKVFHAVLPTLHCELFYDTNLDNLHVFLNI